MPRRAVDTYSLLQIILHQLVVILIITTFLLSDRMEDWKELPLGASPPPYGKIGLTVFFLMLLWLAIRLFRSAPPPPKTDPTWQPKAAELTHWVLYSLAILTPRSVGFAFYLRLEEAAEIHEMLKTLPLVTTLLHTAAALYHQFVLKDGLSSRMRPGRG